MLKTLISLSIGKLRVLAVSALLTPLVLAAEPAKLVEFDATPLSEIGESGQFKSCGYQLRTRLSDTGLDSAVQVVVQRDKANVYFLTVAVLERADSNANWTPRNNVVQWVRVNNMEPLLLEPFNLVTTPERGVSMFSRQMVASYDMLKEVEAKDSTLWVSVLDKTTQEIKVFSGIIALPKSSAVVGQQCQENLATAKN